ncbi:STAS domain-containing protein [Chitinispirillales bacterium ANBcel5]|uniref:STAS domain-containing protein n=1 Tax=Cellulosispirillum alkaliphilum TaxID=3039283 RepID=UPI002A5614A4|nr:STAS domain-containing protein [Chitinispirillales bacterium ANBcel5]
MKSNHGELSDEMYRRVYRLVKREVEPRIIAATLKLPYKTVQNVTYRLKQHKTEIASTESSAPEQYLDLYFFPKTRYAQLQMVGMVVDSKIEGLKKEFEKILSSKWKVVVLEMSDVLNIDEVGAKQILHFHQNIKELGRYAAILDPSPEIENQLNRFGLEEQIPVFGTLSALENSAFSKNSSWSVGL